MTQAPQANDWRPFLGLSMILRCSFCGREPGKPWSYQNPGWMWRRKSRRSGNRMVSSTQHACPDCSGKKG